MQHSLITPDSELYSLKNFQRVACVQGINFLRKTKSLYNACEQRLGKTAQTITILNSFPLKRGLIVAPKSVLFAWQNEFSLWGTGQTSKVITSEVELRTFSDDQFHIISYDLASRHYELVEVLARTLDKQVIIFDEAHALRYINTHRTKRLLNRVAQHFEYKIYLSATPLDKSAEELWPIFSKIMPQVFGDYTEFVTHFCHEDKTPYGTKFTGIKNDYALKEIIRSNFFLRYTKQQVEAELDEKQRQVIPLSDQYALIRSTSEQQAFELYLKLLKAAYKSGTKHIPRPPEAVTTRLRMQGLKKVPATWEFVKDLLDQNIPTVLFMKFHESIQELKNIIPKGYPYGSLSGADTAENRAEVIKQFQAGLFPLLILQIDAFNEGITLNRASTIVMGEIHPSYRVITQAEARCTKLGVKHPVVVYYPIIKSSNEAKLFKVVMQKEKIFQGMFND